MPSKKKSEKSTRKETGRKKSGTATKPAAKTRSSKPAPRTHARTDTTTKRRAKEHAPVMELAAQTAHDYTQAKQALGQLWEDVTKTTYSAFNNIAVKVEKRFAESRKAISDIDVRYALDKTGEKIKSVAKSTSAAAQQMARQVKLLYMMLKDSTSGKFKAPWVAVSAITAALLYFISPIDVLPDFIPGIGLIDDALVLSLCISVIRMDLRRYVKEKNLDLAEYGLAKEKSRSRTKG